MLSLSNSLMDQTKDMTKENIISNTWPLVTNIIEPSNYKGNRNEAIKHK